MNWIELINKTMERILEKVFSAKWLWAVGALAVFMVASLDGSLDGGTVKDILLLIVGAYFGASIAKEKKQ